jgi:hypothetical protein|nr:MAG TPA: Protein of unknown function (DUF551) [Caudoviricetes sp.]
MSDLMTFIQNEDGAFSVYDDTYDIVIHCESKEKQDKTIEHLKSTSWIPVTERLPEEHDSIFAKFKGTNKWSESMFERTSYEVIVTVKYADGTILTETAYTKDGEWKLSHPTFNGIVIAWQPFPNPYKED